MTDGGPVTNVVTVISSEWLAWLRLKGGGQFRFYRREAGAKFRPAGAPR